MRLRRLLILIGLLALPVGAQQTTQCLTNGGTSYVYAPCSMAPQPNFVQSPVSAKSTGSVASINAAYGSNVTYGNTLVVVFANGNNNNPTTPITDTLSLTWFKAVQVANSTAFESEIWYAPDTTLGKNADTVTVTPGGSNASIAMTIYEVPGLVFPAINKSPAGPQALDQTTSNTGTGGTSPSVSLTPIVPNEYVFTAFGLGTAAQTITVVSPYSNDSGQQNPTTPAGLFSFVSASLFKSEMVTTSPSATATSEPWAVAVASFKTLSVPFQGTMQGMGSAGTPSGGVVSVQGVASGTPAPVSCTFANCVTESQPTTTASTSDTAATCYLAATASTNSTSCKGSAGNVYGIYLTNTTTTDYYLRMYNASSAPTCSSATGFIETIPAFGAAANGGGISRPQVPQAYSTGIGFCITGGSGSTDNTNAAAGVYVTILYK